MPCIPEPLPAEVEALPAEVEAQPAEARPAAEALSDRLRRGLDRLYQQGALTAGSALPV